MRAVPVDDLDARMEGDILAKDPENRLSLHNSSTERMLGLKPNDENSVPRIACPLRQVVKNSPVLHHPRRGNYHHRTVRPRYGL